jgi:hypothetical protein
LKLLNYKKWSKISFNWWKVDGQMGVVKTTRLLKAIQQTFCFGLKSNNFAKRQLWQTYSLKALQNDQVIL